MTDQQIWACEQTAIGPFLEALKNGSKLSASYTPLASSKQGDTRIIEARGVLTKYQSPLQSLFGGASALELQNSIQAALSDPSVSSIVLVIDSPGGQVAGIPALADTIFNARASGKPIVVQIDGLCASAALWAASGASKIFASHATDRVGSIGAMQVINDSSRQAAAQGVDVFVATTGSLKPIGVPGVALTDDMKAYLQAQVQQTQTEFVNALVRGRGMKRDRVTFLADGSVFSASDAKVFGLIDGIQSLETTLSQLSGTATKPNQQKGVKNVSVSNHGTAMSAVEEFRAEIAKRMSGEKLDRARAASAVVREMPELHARVLAETSGRPMANGLSPAGVGSVASGSAGESMVAIFRREVEAMVQTTGDSKGRCVSRWVSANPERHQQMLHEMQYSR